MHVLLIEDSHRLQESLCVGLRRSGYAVDAAGDGEAGLRFATHNRYDVIILDLMLPKIDGLTVLRRLRENADATHVLILTARDGVDDRVLGLRRAYHAKNTAISVGPITIDTAARTVMRDGEEIRLSQREYALLEYLAFRKGHIVERREIEDHLYGEDRFPMSNAVDRMVCTVRKKIERENDPPLLRTRRGLGYMLDGPTP
jgi:DNA-binding response OmpR family regulator